MTKRELHQATGAILCGQTALFYFEEVKHTKMFKHKVKNSVNNAIKALQEVEKLYFDKVDEIDDNKLSDKLTANLMDFINLIQKGRTYNDFCALQQILGAYDLEPNAIKGIADKINRKHK
jgi:hypothetical protein